MTRKDFELIAKVLKGSENRIIDDLALEGLAETFADYLTDTNPNFDRARFLTACGVSA